MFYTNNIFNNRMVTASNIKYTSCDDANYFDTYMLESLIYLNESYYTISREYSEVIHIGLMDDNADILEEGFNDFIVKVKEFFQKLIKSITDFFKKVTAYITSFFGEFDKFIQNNKTLIDAANPDFDIKGYEYTFNTNSPNLSILKDLINEFNSKLSHLDKMTKEDVLNMRTEYGRTSTLDNLRGDILGVNYDITQDTYLAKIKEHFRDNKPDIQTIHVNKSKLHEVVKEYPELKKKFLSAQKEKNDTIRLLTDIKSFFERSARVQYNNKNKVISTNEINADDNKFTKGESVNYAHNAQTLEVVNMYFKFRFEQAKDISIMTTNVFNEKIKAMRECLHLYRSIVRKSIFSNSEKGEDDNK